jgi:hypothetical protein
MPNAMLRANARTMRKADLALRARLAEAAERIIAALDALDVREEDLEDGHDAEEEINGRPSLRRTPRTKRTRGTITSAKRTSNTTKRN